MSQNEEIKKFDRIVSIFTQLQSKRIVKAQDLARRFGVSLRTIYRDMRTLEASGVPIYSEAGIGYTLLDGYRLPPVMFSQEEATSFVAAEKLMEKFTDPTMRKDFDQAMHKIKAVLRGHDKDRLSSLEEQVVMKNTRNKFHAVVPNALSSIFESIARKCRVRIIYDALGNNDITDRELEIVGVFHEYNYWYVIAYCFLRDDYRQFRMDRIQKIMLLDTPFIKLHESLDYYLQKEKENVSTTKVVIEIPSSLDNWLSWERHYFGFVDEVKDDNKITMHFEVQNLDGFARWYMMYGDQANIIEPLSLKGTIKELAESHLRKL